MFEEFWSQYPRKVAKRVAQKAWNRLALHEQVAVLDTIQNHVEYWKLKETTLEFIPHPATWLNQGRWEDELDLTPRQKEKPAIPWYSTDSLTLQKGKEIGIEARPGETMPEYRQRIAGLLNGTIQVSMLGAPSTQTQKPDGIPRLSDLLKRKIPQQ